MYLRKILVGTLMALTLVGCGSSLEPVDKAIADIRDGTTTLTHSSDEDLRKLMRESCNLLDETNGNMGAFALVAMRYDLNPRDVGVVVANAIQSMCPEHNPNKD